MDTERAEAIVLRLHHVTESSLIVMWFTRESGKLRTMAKGARRPKSPFRGKIDLFYRAEILFLRSRRSDLHLLHDCFLEDPHKKLRDSVEALTASSYVGELVDLATEWEDPNQKLFDVLCKTLDALEIQRARPAVIVWFATPTFSIRPLTLMLYITTPTLPVTVVGVATISSAAKAT